MNTPASKPNQNTSHGADGTKHACADTHDALCRWTAASAAHTAVLAWGSALCRSWCGHMAVTSRCGCLPPTLAAECTAQLTVVLMLCALSCKLVCAVHGFAACLCTQPRAAGHGHATASNLQQQLFLLRWKCTNCRFVAVLPTGAQPCQLWILLYLHAAGLHQPASHLSAHPSARSCTRRGPCCPHSSQ